MPRVSKPTAIAKKSRKDQRAQLLATQRQSTTESTTRIEERNQQPISKDDGKALRGYDWDWTKEQSLWMEQQAERYIETPEKKRATFRKKKAAALVKKWSFKVVGDAKHVFCLFIIHVLLVHYSFVALCPILTQLRLQCWDQAQLQNKHASDADA